MLDIDPQVFDPFMEWFSVGTDKFKGFRASVEEDQQAPGGAIYRSYVPFIVALVTEDFPEILEGDTITRDATNETFTVPYPPFMGNINQIKIPIIDQN